MSSASRTACGSIRRSVEARKTDTIFSTAACQSGRTTCSRFSISTPDGDASSARRSHRFDVRGTEAFGWEAGSLFRLLSWLSSIHGRFCPFPAAVTLVENIRGKADRAPVNTGPGTGGVIASARPQPLYFQPFASDSGRHPVRHLRSHRPHWRRRDGASVPRTRYEAESRSRAQSPPGFIRERSRSTRPVHARSADAGISEPSEHRAHTRPRRVGRCTCARDGTR